MKGPPLVYDEKSIKRTLSTIDDDWYRDNCHNGGFGYPHRKGIASKGYYKIQPLLNLLKLPQGASVLDATAGRGGFVQRLSEETNIQRIGYFNHRDGIWCEPSTWHHGVPSKTYCVSRDFNLSSDTFDSDFQNADLVVVDSGETHFDPIVETKFHMMNIQFVERVRPKKALVRMRGMSPVLDECLRTLWVWYDMSFHRHGFEKVGSREYYILFTRRVAPSV